MSRTHVRGPEPVEIAPDEHLPGRFRMHAEAHPDQPLLAHAEGSEWTDLTRQEVTDRVRSIAAGLVTRRVRPGDRVALMSETRLEWTLADLAVLDAGAVTVPLYNTSSLDQCRDVIADARPTLAVVSNAELADRIGQAGDVDVVVLDDGGLVELADDAGADDGTEVDRRREQLSLDDMATIVYTSGTTGTPKGCVISHGNLAWTTRQAQRHLAEALDQGGSLLQFLPLAHIFARLIQFVCVDAGLRVGYTSSLDDVADDLRTFRPTLLLGVPRVFEKFVETASSKATGVRRPLFEFAHKTGTGWGANGSPGPWAHTRRALSDVLVYRRMRAALGGQVRHGVAGGAPLPTGVARLFDAAKVPVLEGYGLTETTAPATVNPPSANRIGTVGLPLPGVEIRLDDGEVLVKGGNVFQGYHGKPERTADDLDDGWFRTGDLGEIDDEGYLTLGDRKKDVIVTASGKNVAPTPLEDAMSSSEIVAQAMVVGDRRKFVAALVTLDEDRLRAFADDHGIDAGVDELRRHDRVYDEVQRAVDRANASVSEAESIREFVIVDRQFSAEHGELTPTLKLRRNDIAEHFADEIESIYA